MDELTTADIKRFATEHFSLEEPGYIEWIDDTSANIVYSTKEMALKALLEFTQQHVEDDDSAFPSLRLRTAKALSTHPDSVLQVRSAVITDRKKRGAHESSRFYLMHPEHDPRERMRKEFADRRRRGRRDDGDGEYTRRRFDDREHRRRRSLARDDKFDVSMYDDDGNSGRRGSSGYTSGTDTASRVRGRGRGRGTMDNDLFPDSRGTSNGRLRDRSASPDRPVGDSDLRFGGSRRFRDRSSRPSRERNGSSRRNAAKELFPSESKSSDDNASRELFPNKTAASYLKKELLSSAVGPNHHRRSDAFDAADETTELFSKRMTVPFVDGANDQGRQSDNRNIELFPDSSQNNGHRIRGASSEDQGISIRGNSNGLSIKGAAAVRELFPSKYSGNVGKELFSDKLEGRGGRRRKAEDMFY